MKGILNRLLSKVGIILCGLVLMFSLSASAQRADSLLSPQERQVRDSINIRKGYLQSKHYKDSVEQVRLVELAALRAARQRTIDSLAAERKRVSDSLIAARKHFTDSVKAYNDSVRVARALELERVKAERKRISDSLAADRAYRTSKGYQDSVAVVRKQRQDSLAALRKNERDSIAAVQQAARDSTIAARKQYNDSLRTALEAEKAERMRLLDSMAVVREARADSMAKLREARAAERKSNLAKRTEERQKKKSLALEMEIKKKQEAYTNEKMRRKKWSLPRQMVQNTFTRYNYYFNADLKMDEAIDNMLRAKNDDYDALISLFPFDPDVDSAMLAPDMDTIIRKASVGIQIHDPRAKWQDDLYLLVGQAYYYKGDYKNAAAAFQYIIAEAEALRKEKEKKSGRKEDKKKTGTTISEPDPRSALVHKSVKNEAVLWLSRTLTQDKKEGQAQALVDMLAYDESFPERLKGRLALEQAFIHINNGEDTRTVDALEIVVADKSMPQWLRLRASYLNGQLLQRQGKYAASSKYFALVNDLHPNLEMDFFARKHQAMNSLTQGGDKQEAGAMLLAMAGDAKFRPYFDQIYYALGKTALADSKKEEAMAYLKQSLSYNQNNKKQRGMTYTAMADEHYANRAYTDARSAYDSAAALLAPGDEPFYSVAIQRAQALDRIVVPGEEVRKQDSLLVLAALDETAQRKIVRDYIREWEKRQNDSLFRAQNASAPVAQMTPRNQSGSPTWYFANPDLVKKGALDFKTKWGDRALKDNWRRSLAGSSGFDGDEELLADEDESRATLNEDSLMAAIPRSPEAIQAANQGLMEGLFQLGKGYYTYLEDYPNAENTFDTLNKRYPRNEHDAEVLYTRYLMALRQNDQQTATQYHTRLQTDYPESEWAKILKAAQEQRKDSELYASNSPAVPISNHYDETYGLLMQRQYSSVLRRVADADEMYPRQGNYQKKYTLMKAIAIAGTGQLPEADTMLSRFVAANPDDSLTTWANAVLDYIRKQDYTVVPRPSDTLQAAAPVQGAYEYLPLQAHYVIIAAEQDARLAALKSALVDYNLMNADKEDVVVTISGISAGEGAVVCRGFANAAEARVYLNDIKRTKAIFSEYEHAGAYQLLLISEENFSRLLQAKDIQAYKTFFGKHYK